MQQKNATLFILLFLGFISSLNVFGQEIIYGTNNYISYQKGTLPIVISVPHGGQITPNTIPDRTCNSPTTVTDSNTIQLAQEISNSLFQLTGCYPYIIYCNLKRTKIDCNRNISDGACGNPAAVIAWNEFHNFTQTAINSAKNNYTDKAFYIDLHGHGHSIQRLELGYSLSAANYNLSDATLNTSTYISASTIQNLASNNVLNLSHAQLLRGDFALGTLLGDKGFPSVPSKQIPAPGTTAYFSGGYNTELYTNSTMNGVQIECNFDGVRNNATNRKNFADALSPVLVDYLGMHKNTVFSNCNSLSVVDMNGEVITTRLYPNPVAKGEAVVSISGLTEKYTRYFIFNVLGQQVATGNFENEKINLKYSLEKGIYVFELRNSYTSVNFKVFVE